MLRWLTIAACCAVLPFFVANVHAQDGTVEGTVVDAETEDPLPGASVMLQELGVGDAADAEGNFEISGVEPGTYTLTASFVGYEEHTQEVEVASGETVTLSIELAQAQTGLDELVVTGYAVQPRREVTGAISSVRGEDFRLRGIQTPDRALQGQSAGVQLVGASGQPGGASHIRIRGQGSIHAGNDPLFIVDGVQMENYFRSDMGSSNVLQALNPRDIESIEVLRDAEATAIYGAQGANGVVLITTRSGEAGDTRFSVATRHGFSEQVNFFDLMSGPEWVEFMAEAYANRYEDLGLNPEDGRQEAFANLGHPDEVGTYDWPRAMTQRGLSQRYDVSAQGGTEDTRFYISGGYTDQEGTVRHSSFNRINLRANIDHEATDRLSFETNINLSRATQNGHAEGGGNWINSPFHGGVTTRVTTPIYDEGDPTGFNQDPAGLSGVLYNNVQLIEQEQRVGREVQMLGNVAAIYRFNSELNLRAQLNADYRMAHDYRYNNPEIPRYGQFGGSVFERTRQTENYGANTVLNYVSTFGEVHNVRGLAGVEYRQRDYRFHSATGQRMPDSRLGQLNLAAVSDNVAGRTSEYRQAGVFTRLQYNYDQRYFVSGSVRTDGHSRFGQDNRWALFYSGALAWDMAQEPFLRDVDWIDQLRPRISYGITGNSDIGDFPWQALFGMGGTYQGEAGFRPQQLGNPRLTWEQAQTFDLGAEFMLFGGRVYGEAGVYRTDNDELLLEQWLPSDSGFSDIMENVGTVRNEGIELELGVIPVETGNFLWRSEFNATFQRSEVRSLVGDQEWIDDPTVGASRIILGEPRHSWWVRQWAGVNPADGRAMFYDADGNIAYSVGNADFHIGGSMLPDSYGGWNNRFSYGPVSLDVLWQFEFGSRILDEQYSNFHLAPFRERALSPDMWRRWSEPGDVTDIPRAYTESAFPGGTPYVNWSDRRLFDGSYIRLKNVSMSYQLPASLTEQIGMYGMEVFVQSENLLTFTAYPGPDPEVFDRGQTFYPMPRTIELGLQVDF